MRLPSVCSIDPGFSARARLEPAAAGGMAAIQLRDVAQDGSVDLDRLTRVSANLAAERYLVHPGDVVFRSRGDWNTAFAINESFSEPALAVMPLFILRPKAGVVMPEYLAWAINQAPAQRHFDAEAQGGNMRMISRSTLETLDLDIPDLAAQRRIVEIDRLARRERELSLELAAKHRQIIALRLAELAKAHAHISKTSGN